MRPNFLSPLGVLLGVLLVPLIAFGEDQKISFDDKPDMAAWQLTGAAAVDAEKNHGEAKGASLKIGPGGKALLKLREADGAGKVELWIFDDLTAPEKPKDKRGGPRWGLASADGQVVVIGALYAPYIAGDTSYAATADAKAPLAAVQYSALKREQGWHKWTFNFDAEQGLSITLDDKKKARFDWNKTNLKGFNSVVIYGDSAGGKEQTIWLDDITAQLGGAVKAGPVAPPPPPPVVPDKDPAPEKKVEIIPALRGQHPRLAFTKDEIPALKEKIKQGPGKQFYDQLLKYLPASNAPADNKYISDATDAQRQGFWRLPTASLHYVLTGDKNSLDKAVGIMKKFLAEEHWESGDELDSGMAAANVMTGAALAYDWLYNDLDPAFRDQFGKKLLLQARRMYYGGHMMKVGKTHYWQSDPQNNHRWHRNSGLTLAAMAMDGAEADWIVAKTMEELEFIHKWLPEDGSSHESPTYLVFGAPYLVLAFDVADRCTGSKLLDHPFFKTGASFRLQTVMPGFTDSVYYGDTGGLGSYNAYTLRLAGRSKQADVQVGLLAFAAASPNAFEWGWQSLLWWDPAVTGGSLDKVAKSAFFPDMGVGIARDGWQAKNVAMMLKCSPYGGATLNEYRNSNNFKYINVAHDDPDANMFLLWGNGGYIAAADGYSTMKLTSGHNTILVDGKGQKGEGGHWTQPLKGKDQDMTKLAWTTAWKQDGAITAVEGEAGGSYAALTRYRRTAVWVEDAYVLLLDDIAANGEHEITWLMQGKKAQQIEGNAGRFRLGADPAACNLRIAADVSYKAEIGESTAQTRDKSLGYQQIQLRARTQRWRLASVFDAWDKGATVSIKPNGEGLEVTVKTNAGEDTWTWMPPTAPKKPSGLTGKRSGGATFDLK